MRGGRAFLVGGYVRDQMLESESKDFDLEVFGLAPESLRQELEIFSKFKKVKLSTVGESFQVYKLGMNLDVSLPRRDRKVGDGHKGFVVEGDPELSTVDAARRRDFTINSMFLDPLTDEVIDHFGGETDLVLGILRMVDPLTFVEDSLRALRAVQFAARFNLTVDRATADVIRSMDLSDLPRERVWMEFEKLMMQSEKPSVGLHLMQKLGINEQLFPELHVLEGTDQEFEWHPEGNVLIHSFAAADEAGNWIGDLPYAQAVTVKLAALFHDLGKYETTTLSADGRLIAHGHAEAGVSLARNMLDRLHLHTIEGYEVRKQVLALVEFHMHPSQFHRQKVDGAAFRRLSTKVDLNLLSRVFYSDSLSRNVNTVGIVFDSVANDWFAEKISTLEIKPKGPDKLLMGRHLIELGMKPGKAMGEILDTVYEMQLDGLVSTVDEGIEAARAILDSILSD